jgi:glutamyl-tRNA synthetase
MKGFAVQLEEDDVFENFINHDSWHESAAFGDPNMRSLQHGDIIQLERKGFYKVDEAQTRPGKPLLLLAIPDGHMKGKKG